MTLPLARGLAAITLAIAAVGVALAHEGHHHDDEEEDEKSATVSDADGMTAAPVVAISTPKLELVMSRAAGRLLIYIDDYATNRPLPGLTVSVNAAGRDIGAESLEPGTYAVPLDLLPLASDTPLHLRIRGKANELALDEAIEGRLPPAIAEPGKGR